MWFDFHRSFNYGKNCILCDIFKRSIQTGGFSDYGL